MHIAHISQLRYGDKLARDAVYPKGSVVTRSLLDVLYSKSIAYVWIEDDSNTEGLWEAFQTGYKGLKNLEVYSLFDTIFDKGALIPDTLVQMLVEDRITLYHSVNVASITWDIAGLLSLPTKQIEEVVVAALLHDIGKLCIPMNIIKKPGKLTDSEFDCIKKHPAVGKEILQQYPKISRNIVRGVSEHHEKQNGTGYNKGLFGCDIHLYARIIAIADVLDALVSTRSYKKAYTFDEALQIMQGDKGHFDKDILELFINDMEHTPNKGFNILRIY